MRAHLRTHRFGLRTALFCLALSVFGLASGLWSIHSALQPISPQQALADGGHEVHTLTIIEFEVRQFDYEIWEVYGIVTSTGSADNITVDLGGILEGTSCLTGFDGVFSEMVWLDPPPSAYDWTSATAVDTHSNTSPTVYFQF